MFGATQPLEPSTADTTWAAFIMLGVAVFLLVNADGAARFGLALKGDHDPDDEQVDTSATRHRRWGYVLAAVAVLSITRGLVSRFM